MTELEQFFALLGPTELIASFLIGGQAGAFYAYQQKLGTRAYHTIVMSGMFFMTLAIVRMLAGEELWVHWLSAWLLSALFAIGNVVGYSVRDDIESRRRKER